jgi:putative ABC transport system permease protein
VLGEGTRESPLGYGPAAGKFTRVNDTWLEVVGKLGEQLVSSGQLGGSKVLHDLSNVV